MVVYPAVDDHQWGTSYAQQPLLFRNLKNGKFERVLTARKWARLRMVLERYGHGGS